MTCDLCPAPAVAFVPGTEEVRIGPFLLQKGRPMHCWCLACAKKAGWPWVRSERKAA